MIGIKRNESSKLLVPYYEIANYYSEYQYQYETIFRPYNHIQVL